MMLDLVYKWLKNIESWFIPSHCCLCDTSTELEQDFCPDCFEELPWMQFACKHCGITLGDIEIKICGHCQQGSQYMDNVIPLFRYSSPLDRLIQLLKFQGQLTYARILGQLMADYFAKKYIEEGFALPEVLIPVPLHFIRQSERGFNQSLEICKTLSKELDIPIDNTLCVKTMLTKPQVKLSSKQRIRNIKNTFKLTCKPTYQHIAIIDDVITTTATMNELAKTLKTAGIERIDGWALCKTHN